MEGCVGTRTSLWDGARSVAAEESGGGTGSLDLDMFVLEDILRNSIGNEELGIERRDSHLRCA